MVEWLKDLQAEQRLTQMGIKFAEQTVELKDVDWQASAVNRARPDGVSAERAEEYSKLMGHGTAFPMPVLRKVGKKFVVVSGNHRSKAAMLLGEKAMVCLVVEVSDMLFDAAAMSLNNLLGVQLTPQQMYDQGVDYAIRYNVPAAHAARVMGVNAAVLSSKLLVHQVKLTALKHGIRVTTSDTALQNLGAIGEQSEPVLVAALKAIEGRKLTAEDAAALRTAIANKKSEHDKIEEVSAWLKTSNLQVTKDALKTPVKDRILRNMTTLVQEVSKVRLLSQLQMTEKDAAKVVESLTPVLQKLRQMAAGG